MEKSTSPPFPSKNAAVVTATGRQRIEQTVDEFLCNHRYVCSPEYRAGMLDGLAHRVFGSPLLNRFKRGTVQSDAHWAGVVDGLGMSLRAERGL